MEYMVFVAEVSFAEWVLGVGFFVSTFGFVITLYKMLYARAEKRREIVRRETLEGEMRDIQRRGRAPFLSALYLHVPKLGEAPNKILKIGQAVVPSEVPDGTAIFLQIANTGEPVRNFSDDWPSGEGFSSDHGNLSHNDYRAADLLYRYDSKTHGELRRIKITFETFDGLKLYQNYETKLGYCELHRVDPA